MTFALAGKLAIVALGVIASWLDITSRRLPNWLSLLTLAAGLLVTGFSAGVSAIGGHMAHAAAALLVGMILFRFGVVGGGDAKFYAAIASWFGWSQAAGLLLAVSLSGIGIFLGWFAWRRMTKKPIRGSASASDSDKLPYGIAIAVGGVLQYFVMVL
ncbi:A24 family peptidase [Novosphingobium album (ex Hu et al. 2023)]|uniref:Prepilin peptidase n=1 Tax=Novosphingobium album (ex Hu et al. 2023) TaxID=2930093 RepID=A0ABT0B111_9SPHN|nr:prepilin peptidase [Novosphingobium album (ex Hu et al. 2023)]MCJ2178705.1 prepilin peptidase [Novosphingobium album (ex Hu et al. 2023)]